MGTFCEYMGEMEIAENEKELFTKQIEKVLNLGGMMQVDSVNIYGFRQNLLKPVEVHPGEKAIFDYNYFEDDIWETAEFDTEDCTLYSGKVGTQEFCDVMAAAYMLYEMYTDTTGFVTVNDNIQHHCGIVGWLNQILGTDFSMKKRFRLWENAELFAEEKWECYHEPLSFDDLMCILPRGKEFAAGGTEFTDLAYITKGTSTLNEEEIKPGTYPEDVYRCKAAIVEFLVQAGAEDPFGKISHLVKMNRDERSRITEDGPFAEIARMSLILPARVIIYLTAEQKGMNFWRLWNELWLEVYRDEKMKEYAPKALEAEREKNREMPIPKVRTSEYLRQGGGFLFRETPDELKGKPNYYLSDDDRLYWWQDGSDEVLISEAMDKWLRELAERHREITERLDDEFDPDHFLKDFLALLTEMTSIYKRVYPFQTMFYEFIENKGQTEYRAATELLRQLMEENREEGAVIERVIHNGWGVANKNGLFNPARLRIKRYLGAMANTGLRKKYFGF